MYCREIRMKVKVKSKVERKFLNLEKVRRTPLPGPPGMPRDHTRSPPPLHHAHAPS